MEKDVRKKTGICTMSLVLGVWLLAFLPHQGLAENLSDFNVSQYSSSISGTVTDVKGEPIIGATVKVKGQLTGTVTDLDGHFNVKASKGAVLVVSYIGFKTMEIPVTASSLTLKMEEDNKILDEVVVVGYGTMKKRDLTGSIASVRPDKLANEAPNTVQDVLRGTAGLSVGFSNDAKGGGSMTLRGQRSVYTNGDHNAPLIILDGMIFYGELSEINPSDIQRIDVLKDASSAAVYGAKAANGVILITTKKGKKGKPTVNLNVDWGLSTIGDIRKVYDAAGYINYREDFYKSDTYGVNPETGKYGIYAKGKPAGYFDEPTEANLSSYGLTPDQWRAMSDQDASMTDREIWGRRLGMAASNVTLQNFVDGKSFDWEKQSFRTGVDQNYNISLSGASDNVNYYFSLGYMDNKGIVKGNDYSTVRSNLKLNAQVTSWLSIGADVNFQNRTDGDIECNWASQMLDDSPYSTPYNSDGSLTAHPMGEQAFWKGYNYEFDKQYLELEKGYTVFNNILTAKVKLPLGITYTFNASPRFQYYHNRYYQSSEHPDWSASDHDRVTRDESKRFDWSLNNTLAWDHTFSRKHHVMLTLVQEAEERQSWADNINARNILPTEELTLHATANADKALSDFSSTDAKETAVGYLARAFYSYDNRYMITTSFRRDGYSAFGSTNPYANFFSTAVAWSFTNEKFWKWEPLSMGKFRLSWGKNGNRSLADSYIALANLSLGSYQQGYINSSTGELYDMKYLFMSRLANTHLQWEKTSSWNVGLDLGFLNNRITASLDYYYMPTTDMIMNESLPDFSGFSSITANLGEVVNSGIEVTVNSTNINQKNFRWDTSFNLSYNKNRIKHLYGEYDAVTDADGNVSYKEEDDIANKWFIGHPISAIWDYKVTGIWQKNQVDEAAKYGQRPGDPIVENSYTADDIVNADGTRTPVYNNKDKQFLGQTVAPVHWSLRNTFTLFRDWDFSFNIYSYMGGKYASTDYMNNDNNYSQITNCRNVYVKEYWTPDHSTSKYARINAQGPTGIEAPVKIIDRSFIRLENISLAYHVPSKFLAPAKIQSAKIYFTVRNVACWKKEWKFGDPEASQGLTPRMYTLGFNIIL